MKLNEANWKLQILYFKLKLYVGRCARMDSPVICMNYSDSVTMNFCCRWGSWIVRMEQKSLLSPSWTSAWKMHCTSLALMRLCSINVVVFTSGAKTVWIWSGDSEITDVWIYSTFYVLLKMDPSDSSIVPEIC